MAKKMSWTDPQTGAVYPESVWLPLGIFTDFSRPEANIVFLGFASETIARQKLMAVLGIPGGVHRDPIGTKSYPLTVAQTRALAMGAPRGGSMIDALSYPAYEIAAQTPDTPGPDGLASFFAGATDVTLV